MSLVDAAAEQGQDKTMRFVVVGAGAIGSVIGWRLAHAGADVTILGRGEHLQAIQARGLTLAVAGEPAATLPIRTATRTDASEPADVVILATKAQDLPGAVALVRPWIGDHTVVMPAINGIPWWYFKGQRDDATGPVRAVDPDAVLWRSLAASQIIGAVIHWGAQITRAGVVSQTPSPRLIIGELDGARSQRIDQVAQWFDRSGLATTVTATIRDAIWSKLLGNIATNPLSVITGATLDRLFGDPALLAMVRTQMIETLAVGAAYGVRFDQDIESRIQIGRRLGAFRTSMLQDFDRGRPLERGAVSGAVLELAAQAGISMPMTSLVNDLVDAVVNSQALARAARGESNHQERT